MKLLYSYESGLLLAFDPEQPLAWLLDMDSGKWTRIYHSLADVAADGSLGIAVDAEGALVAFAKEQETQEVHEEWRFLTHEIPMLTADGKTRRLQGVEIHGILSEPDTRITVFGRRRRSDWRIIADHRGSRIRNFSPMRYPFLRIEVRGSSQPNPQGDKTFLRNLTLY